MRPIITSSGPPPGYVMESAAVAYGSRRSFTVAREAQCDYGPGTPIMLIQQGKLIPAFVENYTYDGTRMTIVPNTLVDSSIIGVYRDASAPFVYGCYKDFLSQLYHFETSLLYDSGLKASDHGSAGMTLWGSAPTILTSNPAPKFGSQCYQFSGGTAFYAGTGGVVISPSMGPIPQLGASLWSLEAYFYGQPNGILTEWQDNYYWGAGGCGYIGFNSGYPVMYEVSFGGYGNTTLFSIQNSTQCQANVWNHCVWCRDATGYMRTAVAGVFGGASNYGSPALGGMVVFGALSGDGSGNADHRETVSGSFSGIIDEMRLYTGFCPYQGGFNFTPPTKPFGPDFR